MQKHVKLFIPYDLLSPEVHISNILTATESNSPIRTAAPYHLKGTKQDTVSGWDCSNEKGALDKVTLLKPRDFRRGLRSEAWREDLTAVVDASSLTLE